MSFLDDLIDIGSSALDFVTSNSVASNVVKTAVLGWGVSKISSQVNKQNDLPPQAQTTQPDPGVRVQADANPENRVPVVYGNAWLGGMITDAALADGNQNLWVVYTISEQTGTKLSDSAQSVITIGDVLINDEVAVFASTGSHSGVQISFTMDRDNNVNHSLSGLGRLYFYSGSSAAADQIAPEGYSLASTAAAYSRMPNWTSNHTMDDLVFCVARWSYNREYGLTSIPRLTFQVRNNMTKAGDCVYDYMTNTRYGAGIQPQDIYSA